MYNEGTLKMIDWLAKDKQGEIRSELAIPFILPRKIPTSRNRGAQAKHRETEMCLLKRSMLGKAPCGEIASPYPNALLNFIEKDFFTPMYTIPNELCLFE